MLQVRNILVKSGPITEITINRPEKHNALDGETLSQLSSAIKKASTDKSCKSIIISGVGGKSFSSGADIRYLYNIKNETEAATAYELFYSTYKQIWDSPKPVIAAINGYCLGGGNELAMSCDFRFASKGSTFAQPEVKLGLVPGGGATYRLKLLTGLQSARKIILTGETIDSKKALSIGLIDFIVNGNAITSASKFAKSIDSEAQSYAKRAINSSINFYYEHEKEMFIKSLLSPKTKELLAKFLNPKVR